MGGCCCCFSNGVELNGASSVYHYPRVSEENEPLSSHHGMVSALSTGLLVDTNLSTSIPDTYRAPPAPLPYDANLSHPQTLPHNEVSCGHKKDASEQTTNAANTLEMSEGDLKEFDCKVQKDTEVALSKDTKVEDDKSDELKKSSEPPVSTIAVEEDVCPICLEEYDAENPKIITKCEHHFHLACILEWMERSDTCPVCDKEMIIDTTFDS